MSGNETQQLTVVLQNFPMHLYPVTLDCRDIRFATQISLIASSLRAC